MNQFSNTSQQRKATCHLDLQIILDVAISISPIDFGIAEGHRPTDLQLKYFKEGKSKIDGINKKGKHNYKPSLAADIYLFINGKASWDKESLSYVMGIIHAVAEILYEQGKITHKIRWGGNWDMDGEILIDQSFDDRPHIELIKPI
ncbi:MAG: hypothetical protein JXR60_12275 [Bacteroidales bacterium]|nr:hypothetical protein [Bacteroidales bacterium]